MSDATSYTLEEKKDSGSWQQVHNGSNTQKSFSDKEKGTYCYRVKATNTCGDSSWSSEQCVTVTGKPDTPTLYSINNDDRDGNYAVSWSSVSNATSCTLQEKKDDGSWADVYSGPNTQKSFTNKPAGTYSYRVKACNECGCSSWNSEQSTIVEEPVLCIEPDPTTGLDFGDTETQMTFQVYNCGSGTLTWSLSESESWITSVEPQSGSSTGSSDKTTVTVTVLRNGLGAGYYNGVITVSPGHGDAQDVTIKMTVPLPVYPQPETQNVCQDSNGTVEIRIGEAITFGGFEFKMKFKHGIIKILTVEHGIPDQQGRNVIENGPTETINGEYTTLFYGAASYGDPPPPSGSLLATITFKGVALRVI